ncbi:MAG: sigma-54 dependent transcriptional regulator [Candidatus Sulfotelmatobacter sp.]|jgi:DNA-binding NtrC family response regulator
MAPNTIETIRLLAVGSEISVLRLLGTTAQSNMWQLETAASGWDAMERVQSGAAPHLLLLDIPHADSEGLHLLLWLRRLSPDLPIVVLCDPGDRNSQKEAVRMGARDVLVRPVNKEQLESLISRNLGTSNDDAAEMASEDIESLGEDEFFLSVSPVMQKVRMQAELLAQTDVPVLILGEHGSGKGTVARLIHKLSVHSGFKFLRVNCSEMPGDLLEIELFGRRNGSSNGSSAAVGRSSLGKLEIGEKGTLLLDEITAMPLALQSRLLQVLQDKRFARPGEEKPVEVGVRILAASSDKLDRALAEKRLQEGLYYRLSAFTIHVPALRQRKDEINALLRYSMHKVARYYGLPPREFAPSALQACLNHSWPGNLEELETFVKRYLVAGDKELPVSGSEPGVGSDGHGLHGRTHSLPATPPEAVTSGATLSAPGSLKSLIQGIKWEAEKGAIAAALEKTGWNRKAAARLLGVSYRTMLYKIDQYHMSASETFLSPFREARFAGSDQAKRNGKPS